MGADKLAENTTNAPKLICPICLPKPKSLGFDEKRLHWASVVSGFTENISNNVLKRTCFFNLYTLEQFSKWINLFLSIWIWELQPQIRKQMSGPDPHVFTLKVLALKKTGFYPIKNTFQTFFDFCLLLFYATFQCGP